jgi:hypothetical protein
MIVGFANQLFDQLFDAGIVDGTSIPTEQNLLVHGKLFSRPIESQDFRFMVWKPFLNLIIQTKIPHRPAADRCDKCHQHDEPEAQVMPPKIPFFEKVLHGFPSARLAKHGMIINRELIK